MQLLLFSNHVKLICLQFSRRPVLLRRDSGDRFSFNGDQFVKTVWLPYSLYQEILILFLHGVIRCSVCSQQLVAILGN